LTARGILGFVTLPIPTTRPSCRIRVNTSPPDVESRFPGGFVGEEERGRLGGRASDRDPLALPAGQHRRPVTHPVTEPDALECASGRVPPGAGQHSGVEHPDS
jgi:hypothetical protein